ncbi:DNA-3-methyladenine glycosylase I [Sphingobacteriales bacterium UPWRP_1]|nr:DNA-3-methyladenine glycosylase [Sphingobacteriales bacterium TSM_CSM]PSJ78228.1 DNA-3-methyladenine glycosylase I [Sphingobacteriales bacterium UPWRP_1]
MTRCAWVKPTEQLAIDYHDTEWGVPVHDDRKLFEFLVLDAFQAGLSWNTILRKRENFRAAFHNFEAAVIANYTDDYIAQLLQNEGIIRNRLKVYATVNNAQRFLQVQTEFGSFDHYIWQFTQHRTLVNQWERLNQIPAKTAQSDAMSKDLQQRGFKFVGSTICYAFMQAAGMVNDHTTDCFRYNLPAYEK